MAPPAPAVSFFGPAIPRGILLGTAAALVYGLVWYAATAFTDTEWFPATVVMGTVVGLGVRAGTGRGGAGPAIIAMALTVLGILATHYFVLRHVYQLIGLELPLLPRFNEAREVLTGAFDELPLLYLWSALALVSAAVVAGKGGAQRDRRTTSAQPGTPLQPSLFGQALNGKDQPKEVRAHPNGGAISVLGVLSIVTCGGIISIITWVMANRALEEMRTSRNVTWMNKNSITTARKRAVTMFWIDLAICAVLGMIAVSRAAG